MVKNASALAAAAAECRELSARTVAAALTAAPGFQLTVLEAAERLDAIAASMENKAKRKAREPAIAILPGDATVEEVRTSRKRQATRRGEHVYLPSWTAMAQALPNAFLRSALFSTSGSVQSDNDKVLSGDKSLLVAGKEIASYKDTTLTFSGYELCQFDRKVYSTCLDYYRESPLPTEASSEHVRTSFYEFATRMGQTYGLNTHRAIRASLLRLSFAQMRMRYNRWNLEIPKLLSVSFEDGEPSGDFKGSDILLLKVSVSLAELFGPGEWTAIDKRAVGYDGLQGWLSNFYAGHARGRWVDVAWLQKLSGYKSHIRNFRAGLITALDKLKSEQVPEGCRVKDYHFSKDGEKLLVLRPGWTKPSEASV